MISYCIAVIRPTYARLLIRDLARKNTSAFEVLIWLNVVDEDFERDLAELRAGGYPLRVVGKSPENIGMAAYRELFRCSRHPMIAQIDDDVVCVSRGIPERAARLFARFPDLRQLVADVWRDEFTTGARPALSSYRCVDGDEGLYEGPIDGWFAVYHRSILPLLLGLSYRPYLPIGAMVRGALSRRRLRGLLCMRMRVFHVIGPQYASLFGMLRYEIEKYRRLGRQDIVDWYEGAIATLPARHLLESNWARIAHELETFEDDVRRDVLMNP